MGRLAIAGGHGIVFSLELVESQALGFSICTRSLYIGSIEAGNN